jgi:hypothetical protein
LPLPGIQQTAASVVGTTKKQRRQQLLGAFVPVADAACCTKSKTRDLLVILTEHMNTLAIQDVTPTTTRATLSVPADPVAVAVPTTATVSVPAVAVPLAVHPPPPATVSVPAIAAAGAGTMDDDDDSNDPRDNVSLAAFGRTNLAVGGRTNLAVGNPATAKGQKQRRLQPSVAPTSKAYKTLGTQNARIRNNAAKEAQHKAQGKTKEGKNAY